jgi:hypothetical protein
MGSDLSAGKGPATSDVSIAEYRTEPGAWLIPVNPVEALLIRSNLQTFVAVGLDELGYGIAQSVKVREVESAGANEWVAEFTAVIVDAPPRTIRGGVAYSLKEHKITFVVRKIERQVSE